MLCMVPSVPSSPVSVYDVGACVRLAQTACFEVPDMRVRRWAMLATLGVIVAEASTGVSW